MAVDVEAAPPSSGADQDTPDGGRGVQAGARRRWSLRRIGLVVAALAILGAVLLFTGGADEEAETEDDSAQDTAPPLSGELNDGYVAFTDPETGISLQHPQSWVPLQRPEGDLRLTLGTGNGSGLRVYVQPIEGVVDTAEELAEVRLITDEFAGPEGVQVVNREAVEVNGMIGISYLARFTDEASGTTVANAHYFLFKGNTMHNLLFQAVPEEDFERLRPEFNQILASFQGVPTEEPPPPTETESE